MTLMENAAKYSLPRLVELPTPLFGALPASLPVLFFRFDFPLGIK